MLQEEIIMNGYQSKVKMPEKCWNSDGYFEEGMPIRIGWFKQFIAAYEGFGWDVAKIHPGLEVSKILEQEVVDRGAVTRLMDYGYKQAGFAFPLAMCRLANWTAMGEIGWMMLTAPTLRHAMGTLATYIPLVDTQCHIRTTDDKDRFILMVDYDIQDRHHKEMSTLVFASALSKFVDTFHGQVQRGNLLSITANCSDISSASLQEVFWAPIKNNPRAQHLEISLDAEFASRPNIAYDKRPWEGSKTAMRKLIGAETDAPTKADRYAQLLAMHVANWNYQRDGKPRLESILTDMKISERGLRNLLAEKGVKPKDVMMKAEARRIYLAIKRGHSMTEAAEIYCWSNVTNMKKMVNEYLGKDLKTVKPFNYLDK